MNKRQIHARLIELGSNFRQFALSHGYEPRTVTQAVERWAESKNLPRGRLTFRILRDLSREIGAEVIPGILDEAEEDRRPATSTAPQR
ncbi:hypothetical protein [Azotobacter beijerinckii]|uniref:Phage-associated protein, BcepMu gp16 family n=1 Tax=Azotobacter beijerinckii TaxID=170623 RepID=A0A1I0ZXB0_9GAMM|nr:hypothetical protein [Azotobacter beijerinckii]SFB30231.1 hypothetical protein SAMN04244571_02155 [Azotobacter beijerinckii]